MVVPILEKVCVDTSQKYLYVAEWILCTFSLCKAFEKNKMSAKQLQEMLKCNLEVLSFTQLAVHRMYIWAGL